MSDASPLTDGLSPFDPARLLSYKVPDCRDRYDARETILYALGVGAGSDGDELRYLYEHRLLALPTMALVLGTPGFWLMDRSLGLNWPQILHGEQSLKLYRPLEPDGDIMGRTVIGPLADKGAGRPALLRCDRTLTDGVTGALVASLEEVWVLRGAGGFNGENKPVSEPMPPVPDRAPDAMLELPTMPQQAALYRLTGDRNPLHIDPAVAALGGFERPILHGLSTFGVVARALIRLACDNEPARLAAMRLRFTAAVYPGDRLRTEIWKEAGRRVRFRAIATERNVTVVDAGTAECGGF